MDMLHQPENTCVALFELALDGVGESGYHTANGVIRLLDTRVNLCPEKVSLLCCTSVYQPLQKHKSTHFKYNYKLGQIYIYPILNASFRKYSQTILSECYSRILTSHSNKNKNILLIFL
jgi:hypothetical protein